MCVEEGEGGEGGEGVKEAIAPFFKKKKHCSVNLPSSHSTSTRAPLTSLFVCNDVIKTDVITRTVRKDGVSAHTHARARARKTHCSVSLAHGHIEWKKSYIEEDGIS